MEIYSENVKTRNLFSESRKYSTIYLAHNHFSEKKLQPSTNELSELCQLVNIKWKSFSGGIFLDLAHVDFMNSASEGGA